MVQIWGHYVIGEVVENRSKPMELTLIGWRGGSNLGIFNDNGELV